jgi:adenosylhomocysteinase
VWCLEQQINVNGKPWDANMILDDGGDLTALVHDKYPALLERIHGITEETTTGVQRLLEMWKDGSLKFLQSTLMTRLLSLKTTTNMVAVTH